MPGLEILTQDNTVNSSINQQSESNQYLQHVKTNFDKYHIGTARTNKRILHLLNSPSQASAEQSVTSLLHTNSHLDSHVLDIFKNKFIANHMSLELSQICLDEYSKSDLSNILAIKLTQMLIQKKIYSKSIHRLTTMLSNCSEVSSKLKTVLKNFQQNDNGNIQENWDFKIESRQPELFEYYFKKNSLSDAKQTIISVHYKSKHIKIVQKNLLTGEKKMTDIDPFSFINSEFISNAEKQFAYRFETNRTFDDFNAQMEPQILLDGSGVFYPIISNLSELSFFRSALKSRMAFIAKQIKFQKYKCKILSAFEKEFFLFFDLIKESGFKLYKKMISKIYDSLANMTNNQLRLLWAKDFEDNILKSLVNTIQEKKNLLN